MHSPSILVVGGYGVVGQRVATHLARDYPMIVAGRHVETANAVAVAIGHEAVARAATSLTSNRLSRLLTASQLS